MDSTLQGVALGGTITLLGTVLTQVILWRLQKSDRAFKIRQDAYFEACIGIAKGYEYLSAFGRMDLSDSELQGILDFSSGWALKVHLVAQLKTVERFTIANECLALKAVGLLKHRLVLREKDQRLAALREESVANESYFKQLAAMLSALSAESANRDIGFTNPQLVAEFRQAKDIQLRILGELENVRVQVIDHQKLLFAEILAATFEYQGLLRKFMAVKFPPFFGQVVK